MIMAEEIPTPTLDQTIALSRLGKAHDNLARRIDHCLKLGLRPETIIDFMDSPATQITNAAMRKILQQRVIVPGETEDDEDTVDQEKIIDAENDDTIVIKDE